MLGESTAEQVNSLVGYLAYIAQQGVPFTATDLTLEAWGTIKNITRKTAGAATGNITFTGSNATTSIPAGTILSRSDGTQYSTNTATTINNPVNITAVDTGTNGNCATGTVLTLNSAFTGVDGNVSLTNAITNGTDLETDTDLRNRILEAFQTRASGGSATDHVNWALNVDGVTGAWCNPIPIAGNRVVVYVMMDRTNQYLGYPQGTDGAATSETRYQTATGDQLTVANAMYDEKPVGEIMIICSPLKQMVDITIDGLTNVTSDQEEAISEAITDLFHSDGSPLGSTITTTSIISAISVVVNTTAFTLTEPTSSVVTTTGYLPEIGTINYT